MERKTKKIIVLFMILVLMILSFAFDRKIFIAFQKARESLEGSFINKILEFTLKFENIFLGSIFYFSLILFSTVAFVKMKKKPFPLLLSFLITAILVFLLKYTLKRPRPIAFVSNNDSFPSGHSSMLFTALPFFNGKLFVIWLIISCFFVFVRVWFGLHYLSDILFGAFIGYLVGFVVKRFFKINF